MNFKPKALSGVALAALIGATIAISAPANAAEIGAGAAIDTGVGVGNDAATGAAGAGAEIGPGAAPSAVPSVDGDIGAGAVTSTPSADMGAAAGASGTTDLHATAPVEGTASTAATAGAGTTAAIGTTAIADLPDASQALASASVQSKDGASIGTVEGVSVDSDGKPQQVKIDLGGSGSLGLAASDLSFDATNKILVASLSQSELKSLAAAQKQTR